MTTRRRPHWWVTARQVAEYRRVTQCAELDPVSDHGDEHVLATIGEGPVPIDDDQP